MSENTVVSVFISTKYLTSISLENIKGPQLTCQDDKLPSFCPTLNLLFRSIEASDALYEVSPSTIK